MLRLFYLYINIFNKHFLDEPRIPTLYVSINNLAEI